jgi:hypothetical protein
MERFEPAKGALGCEARVRHATCWLAWARCGRCRASARAGLFRGAGAGLPAFPQRLVPRHIVQASSRALRRAYPPAVRSPAPGLGLASAPAWGWRGPNRAPAVICFGAHPHTCAEGLFLLFGGVRNRQNKSAARSSPSFPAVRFFPSGLQSGRVFRVVAFVPHSTMRPPRTPLRCALHTLPAFRPPQAAANFPEWCFVKVFHFIGANPSHSSAPRFRHRVHPSRHDSSPPLAAKRKNLSPQPAGVGGWSGRSRLRQASSGRIPSRRRMSNRNPLPPPQARIHPPPLASAARCRKAPPRLESPPTGKELRRPWLRAGPRTLREAPKPAAVSIWEAGERLQAAFRVWTSAPACWCRNFRPGR